ncbi:hypothetical protein Ade02nite_70230 [Paractinoplanes deccanensis]|uniref:Insertion element IS402-like domain-containing protein n=1 Tax=Paractinoplanes deccanensis TaxID=113561 RepID=A0ABQ3YEG2_9ACTN|nr:hypothetical protein Ade02nite_70230 [Actinoplanes deccanensis]
MDPGLSECFRGAPHGVSTLIFGYAMAVGWAADPGASTGASDSSSAGPRSTGCCAASPAAGPPHDGNAAPRTGRTPTHDLREIFNAILHVNRTGIAWRYLPHDFPPHATVYSYLALWSKEGIFTELNWGHRTDRIDHGHAEREDIHQRARLRRASEVAVAGEGHGVAVIDI